METTPRKAFERSSDQFLARFMDTKGFALKEFVIREPSCSRWKAARTTTAIEVFYNEQPNGPSKSPRGQRHYLLATRRSELARFQSA
jgi:hypothetical protein